MIKILTNLTRQEIQTYQHNKFPFLYIDFIKKIVVGEMVEGYKKFLSQDWGDNFNNTIPCFVVSEACEHAFLMTFLTMSEFLGQKTNTLSLDVKFFNEVYVNQQLDIVANLHSIRRGIIKGESKGYVNNKLVCELHLTLCIPTIMNLYKPKSN